MSLAFCFSQEKPHMNEAISKNIDKILIASCFSSPIDPEIKKIAVNFLLKSIKIIFNNNLVKKLEKSNLKYDFKKTMFNYLSQVFPIEFYVYFDTIEFKNSFAVDSKNELKRYQKHKKRIGQIIFSNFRKIRKMKNQIKQRKSLRSQLHNYRSRFCASKKVKYLEKCKETKILSHKNVEHLGELIEFLTNTQLPFLRACKKLLKLLNYIFTILLKSVKKMDVRTNDFKPTKSKE